MVRVSLRTVVLDVPPQDVITRDNVSVKVNAVVYFRVVHPVQAIVQVENYLYATSQMAQTTLRSVLGQAHLDELLSERERLAAVLQQVIDEHTDPWGIKVTQVAVKAVDLPHEMQRAMAKQAESEREKRAKIIHASGELEASLQLTQAAAAMSSQPMSLHLRYLQTLTEIAAEKNSTIIFPLPIDWLKAFLGSGEVPPTRPGTRRTHEPRPRASGRGRRPRHPRRDRDDQRPRAAALAPRAAGRRASSPSATATSTKSIFILQRAAWSTPPATTRTSGWARVCSCAARSPSRQFVEASKRIRPGLRLGAILVELGALEPEELIPMVELHVKSILMDLFTWIHGEYEFVIKELESATTWPPSTCRRRT